MADAQDLDITHPHASANVGDVENTTVTRVLTVAGGVLAAWIPVLYLRLDAQRVDPASIAAWLGLDVSELLALTALVLATSRRAAATRLIGLVAATLWMGPAGDGGSGSDGETSAARDAQVAAERAGDDFAHA